MRRDKHKPLKFTMLFYLTLFLIIEASAIAIALNSENFNIIVFLILGIAVTYLIYKNQLLGISLVLATSPVIMILPSVPYISSLVPLIGMITFGIYLMKAKIYVNFSETRNQLFFGLMLVFILLSIPGSIIYGSNDRFWVLTYVQLAVMVFMIMGLMKTEAAMKLFMRIIFLAIQVSVIFSIYSYYQASQYLSYARAVGFAGDSNEFAVYTVTGLCIGYYLLRSAQKMIGKLTLSISTVVSVFSLILSGSRGGIIALSVVVLFIGAIDGKESIKPLIIGLCLIIILGVMAFPILPDYQISRILDIPQSIFYGEKTVSLRYELWKTSFRVWKDYPLFGVGSGGVTTYKVEHMLYKNIDTNYVTHNTYINILAEMGLIGFLLFVGIISISIMGYYRSMLKFRRKDQGLYRIAVLFSAILVCWLTACMSLNLQHNRYLWMAIAMGLAMNNKVIVKNQKQGL